jgi:signal transduction histidine kinase/DNA-binding NarL/FixJ family response regulator
MSLARSLWRQAWRFEASPLLAAQMVLIRQNVVIGQAASIPAAILVALVYHRLYGDASIWNWALISCVIDLACIAAVKHSPDPSTPVEGLRMARLLRVMALFIGGMWGALALFYIRPQEPYSVTLVLAMLAGISSSGMIVFAPSWPISLAHLLPVTLPVVPALMDGPPAAQGIAAAVCIYALTMVPVSFRTARMVRTAISLRFANDDLVRRLRDQTQRSLEARQLAEEALHDAEDANRAKVVFMAAASHDLRQPLHALGLFASTLGRTPLSAHQRNLLHQIDQSGQAASELLSTLLDFSKVDTGVIKAQPQPFALQPLLHRLEQEFAPQASQQGLNYRTHDCRTVVVADPALVERILRNLISNAMRYTERGGVLVGVRRRGELASVEVWDSGTGIPLHEIKAIFKEFHQLGNPERDRRKGLGLGLAIVEGLARAMGVDVQVHSAPGRGSVFRLLLPISRELVAAAPLPEQETADLLGARVLVIDDDESVRAAMAELLTSWGAWVEVAESSEQALRLMSRFSPQVVVADYRLRGHQNGREAIDQVRAKAGCYLPAVMVTGDTAPDRLREAHGAGAVLLHKPVPPAQLKQVLTQCLLAGGAQEIAEATVAAEAEAEAIPAGAVSAPPPWPATGTSPG